MADLVIFGAGQFAEFMSVYIRQETQDNIVGYTVDRDYCTTSTFNGLPLVAWEDLEAHYPPNKVQVLGPISYRQANRFRRDRFIEGKKRGYSFYTFIHPSCHIYTQDIGENVIMLEGNIVQPFATIGDNCMLGSNNHIGHHSTLKAHGFLCGRVSIAGNTMIEEGVFWATRTTAIDNITIGAWSLITVGAIATDNIPENSILIREKNKILKNVAKRFAKKLLE
jgi:acetyltransferase-like isoleucine patch superfamily enzyme